MKREFIAKVGSAVGQEVVLRGWVERLRILSKTSFVIVHDCTGSVQCVAATEAMKNTPLKVDDCVEVRGKVRAEPRSKLGFEVDILEIVSLNEAGSILPFNSSSDISEVGIETILDYRPLANRTQRGTDIFHVQAEILHLFRDFLRANHFTEIVTSKIVASGTEGGTNLFEIRYFDRAAYLAQSPQCYKEHGVCGFERVFETGHVYRAEPHATSRHLTEYYSLDLEMGFIDSAEDVIQLERELLTHIFAGINEKFGEARKRFGIEKPLPSMLKVPTWEFDECLERLRKECNRTDLVDDLDSEAERQLCQMAERETGVNALFVLGFPLKSRPFYVHPRGDKGAAESFDCLFEGMEITSGGQRLHRRADIESALRAKRIDPAGFESHLKMYELGMPPHGGFAIGLERLTARILNLANVRECTMYPRDRYRVEP